MNTIRFLLISFWLGMSALPLGAFDKKPSKETPFFNKLIKDNLSTITDELFAQLASSADKGNVNIFMKQAMNAIAQQQASVGTKIYRLIQEGDIDFLIGLLQEEFNIESPLTPEGTTPLMAAVREGKRNIVEMLIERGAQINALDNDDHSVLDYALNFKHDELIPLLMEAGAQPTLKRSEGTISLAMAAGNPAISIEVFTRLLDTLDDVDTLFDGETLLGTALVNNAIDKAILLIQRGANIQRVNTNNLTALEIILSSEILGNQQMREFDLVRIIKTILATGYTFSVPELQRLLIYALINKRIILLKLLGSLPNLPVDMNITLLGGAKVPLQFQQKIKSRTFVFTPLMYAAALGDKRMVRILLDAHADRTIESFKGGWIAADYAFHSNEYALAHLLGSSISPRELLILAIKSNKLNDARYFIQEMAPESVLSPNDADKDGVTPLMIAIVEGHEDIIRLLLEHGGDLQSTTTRGWSAETLVKKQKTLSNSFKEFVAKRSIAEQCASELCTQEEEELANHMARLALKKEQAQQARVQHLLSLGSEEYAGAAAQEDDNDIDDDVDARYLEFYTAQLRARGSLKDTAAQKTQKSRVKSAAATTTSVKPFAVNRSTYAPRVQRWFDNPRQAVLSPEYAGIPEPFFDDIIFRHAFMPLLDRYTRDWALFDAMPERGNTLIRMLCVIIRGNTVERGVLEYVVDGKNVLFHRYFNTLAKHPDIERHFNALPLAMRAHTPSTEEMNSTNAFVVNTTDTYMQLYDPHNQITLFVARPRR